MMTFPIPFTLFSISKEAISFSLNEPAEEEISFISFLMTNLNTSASLVDDLIPVNSFQHFQHFFQIRSFLAPSLDRQCQRVEFYHYNNFPRWFLEIYITIRLKIKFFYFDFGDLGFPSRYRLGLGFFPSPCLT